MLRDKHSSLFCPAARGEAKKVCNIDTSLIVVDTYLSGNMKGSFTRQTKHCDLSETRKSKFRTLTGGSCSHKYKAAVNLKVSIAQ